MIIVSKCTNSYTSKQNKLYPMEHINKVSWRVYVNTCGSCKDFMEKGGFSDESEE
jgi:hypothetical protein